MKLLRLSHLLAILLAASLCSGQPMDHKGALNTPVNEDTAVRFFYQPLAGNYFHAPLIFRVVRERDPRLNTAPMLFGGRTAFVSLQEMKELIVRLANLDLDWAETEKVEAFGSVEYLRPTGAMEITVLSSNGTANASVSPKVLCEVLAKLDSALTTPRALWELQRFRVNYGCVIPRFKPDAYPDHYYK